MSPKVVPHLDSLTETRVFYLLTPRVKMIDIKMKIVLNEFYSFKQFLNNICFNPRTDEVYKHLRSIYFIFLCSI